MSQPQLSIVIPVYNEAAVLARTVQEIIAYLSRLPLTYDIVIVDDGSTDQTAAIASELAQANPLIRLLRSSHRGKGGAVKQGVLEARGRFLLFMDADHATRIDTWEHLAPWLREGYPVVVGSRKMSDAHVVVSQPLLRETMGKIFTWLTNVVLRTGVTDITCGFKGFDADAARTLFQLQRIDGWGFDAEILFLARRLGYRIKEVPVVWRDDPRTKVRLLRDAVRSFGELLTIRLGALRGWYPRVRLRAHDIPFPSPGAVRREASKDPSSTSRNR